MRVLYVTRLIRPTKAYTQGRRRLHHINDGANAPWKSKGEVFAAFFRNLGEGKFINRSINYLCKLNMFHTGISQHNLICRGNQRRTRKSTEEIPVKYLLDQWTDRIISYQQTLHGATCRKSSVTLVFLVHANTRYSRKPLDCCTLIRVLEYSQQTDTISWTISPVYDIKQTCPSQAALLLCWLWFVCQSWRHWRQTHSRRQMRWTHVALLHWRKSWIWSK